MHYLAASLLLFVPYTFGCNVYEPDAKIEEPVTIQSPGYPFGFPSRSNCNYFVKSSSATHFQLSCGMFDLDPMVMTLSGETCHYNYLSINLGKKYNFCGQVTNAVLKSPSGMNTFQATFYSYARRYFTLGFKCQLTFYSGSDNTDIPEEVSPTTQTIPEELTTEEITASEPSNPSEVSPTEGSSTSSSEECSCGKSTVNRIVGGETADQMEYPWQAMLMVNDQHFCGGTLIAPNIVLTAAHCTDSFTASSIDVSLGDHSKNVNEAESMVVGVKEIIQHPDYDSTTVNNDIALLILEEDVPYSDAIQPACLPFNFNMDEIYGQDVTVSGWGTTTQNGNVATVLQEVTLPLLSTSSCSSYYPGSITDNMICTYEAGLDSCQGDSGGPLVYDDAGSNYVVGVVSWGVGCAQEGNPGVYAKVTNYLDWIEENTSYDFCKA